MSTLLHLVFVALLGANIHQVSTAPAKDGVFKPAKGSKPQIFAITTNVTLTANSQQQQAALVDQILGLWKRLSDPVHVTGFNILIANTTVVTPEQRNVIYVVMGLADDTVNMAALHNSVTQALKSGSVKGVRYDDAGQGQLSSS